jgi:hypothetical protein
VVEQDKRFSCPYRNQQLNEIVKWYETGGFDMGFAHSTTEYE